MGKGPHGRPLQLILRQFNLVQHADYSSLRAYAFHSGGTYARAGPPHQVCLPTTLPVVLTPRRPAQPFTLCTGTDYVLKRIFQGEIPLKLGYRRQNAWEELAGAGVDGRGGAGEAGLSWSSFDSLW